VTRRGKDLGSVLKDVARKAGIDHSRKLDVVKREDAGGEKKAQGYASKQAQTKRRGPKAFLKAETQ